MKRFSLDPDWPPSWKLSYAYDQMELYGDRTYLGYTYGYEIRRAEILKHLRQRIGLGSTVLDVAGAQGNFSIAFAEIGYRTIWNDIREDLIPYVQMKHESGEIEFLPGDIFCTTPQNPVDCICASEVIEHVAHPDLFLKRLADLITDSGVIILTTPNGAYFRNTLPKFSECPDPSQFEQLQFKPNADGHIFLLYDHEIETLAHNAGLKIDAIDFFGLPTTHGHMKLRYILPWIPKSCIKWVERHRHRFPRFILRKITHSMIVVLRK
ncbi:MAG: methyltransferase domain-containing protein [Bdellovibrionales bacterium]|nr:methyltransferase domain-containing protein [Bdellovibrionales bacterium]